MDVQNTPNQGGAAKSPNAGMAIVAYILFFIPLMTDAKNDPFVKYHVKQGLALFILYVINMFIGWIPVIGWMVSYLISLGTLVLLIIGIMNVLNNKQVPLPVVGKMAEGFKI
jgi:uncharacterized membrane protein